MIYIFTALYCEADIFIRHFHLVKNQESAWFQQFYNETAGVLLTVTGVGEIAAASVVGSVCSLHRPAQGDLLFNVGICAHSTEHDGIFLCNKIMEKATGRTFYPDMLYRHHFAEGTVVTGMLPYRSDKNDVCVAAHDSAGMLYDMEAAAVYQAASHFFGPHQMVFLKVVSDSGDVETVSGERTALLMEKYRDSILDYVRQMSAIMQENRVCKSCPGQAEKKLVEKFCMDLHCSRAMEDSMKQYIRYLALAGTDYVSVIQDMYEKKLLPCRDKREGKRCFEEFKRRLF